MFQPPGFRGAAFSTGNEGDLRTSDRGAISNVLGISTDWATVSQVHGAHHVTVDQAGPAGEADAIVTTTQGLPIAVFTADCGGVVLESDPAVSVVHAGWRGAAAGVVAAAADAMPGAVVRAALGPTIGPCCFEVGDEVATEFPDHVATTTWGTTSVDLRAAIRAQVPGVEWWTADACTRCDEAFYSHRRDATPARMASLGWMP